MEIQQDFKELLALLNAHNVNYMVVGGYALAHYGAPRYTGDIDIYVQPDPENALRVLAVLTEFGFGSVGLKQKDFSRPNQVVQLGYPPVRIDIITSISGVSWQEADAGSIQSQYGDIPVTYIGRTQLVANKKATGRIKDQADLETLGEL